MPLSPEDLEKLADLTVAKLCETKRAKWIDPDLHEAHHEWVNRKMKADLQREEMRTKIIESSLAWAFPMFLAFIGASIWQYIKALLKAPTP